ncbi:hypothetical protein [Dubosiella newyorkensis]|uniref:DUF5626 domain-containing protein n=1 Tax=Dubosiella newyorkensis TaxID=1862672 RepID=A0A1U7NQH1_9FIRM|nr:hypothetical protein [Dubosiella newyorkensis]OLU47881.1 hypothetical protein BO225_00855 [Dubosiella newyorkensis]
MKKVLLSLALCFSFFTLFFPIDISVYAEEVLNIQPRGFETINVSRQFTDTVYSENKKGKVTTIIYGSYVRNVNTGEIVSANCSVVPTFSSFTNDVIPQARNIYTYANISSDRMSVTFGASYRVIGMYSSISYDYGIVSRSFTVQ